MDENVLRKIKKIKALAERGVGGEKSTAEQKLKKLLEENGIVSLDELEREQAEFELFSYNGKYEKKLLMQCMYKVLKDLDFKTYHRRGTKQKVGIYCTKAEKIEIQLEFDFYKNALHEEMDRLVRAFIQANKIFPDNTPYDDSELTEEDIKIMSMSSMIEKRNLKLQLFFRLCVHMTEQQDKIIASSEVNGLITNI